MTSLAHSPIPVVLFVLKKQPDLTGGDLRFEDTSGDVIFKVNHQSSHNNKRPFLDSNRNPLISIYCYHVSLSISISPSVLHLICNAHQLFKTTFKSTCFFFFLVSYTGSHSKTMKAFILCTLNY